MVAHRGAVIRHPPEILLVVVLRPELIGPPPLGVVVVPVVIVSVSPVVSVAVLVVGPLSGQVVGSVSGTVAVHVPPVPVVVVLVPVLLVLVVPVTPPGRVAVATAIVELPFPLPVSSICVTKVSLVGVVVAVSRVPVRLRAVGGGQVRLLRVKAVRGVGLGQQRVPA